MIAKPANHVRIGGASGFWGDSAIATPQLLEVPGLDYLVYDYLAETTMAILARAQTRDPALGYATDFVSAVIEPHLATLLERKVRLIANAGGLNPLACRDAVLRVAERQGLAPRVAVVSGDDLLPAWSAGAIHSLQRLDGEAALPAQLLSMSAYIGARGIADALASGADIVITGRVVDSAVVCGALVHEFGWSWRDWDRLAGATLAGHLIECGAQATGGLFTDWERVEGWDNIGYPLIDCAEDGSCVLGKPDGTGGLIDPLAVSEQLLYEVGDPSRYLMPDVTCDLTAVQARRHGPQAVRISGAKGLPPTDRYKGNATWQDGYQFQQLMAIRGIDAPAKARRTAEALLARTRRMLQAAGHADYSATRVELLGCESLYGAHARRLPTREVVLRIAVRHAEAKALRFLQKECSSAGTSMAAGTRSTFSGRADIQSLIRVLPFTLDKSEVQLTLHRADGECVAVEAALGSDGEPEPTRQQPAPVRAVDEPGERISVPLLRVAVARSGDKGDDENIAVIARRPEWLACLREQLTAEVVGEWFAHLVQGEVERFDVPGLHAMNFLLHNALDGGGVSSLRSDPLGKSFAQMLLDLPVRVPAHWLQPSAATDREVIAEERG
ncbi:Acyclic terpene utilization family protein AtuA [compost metagenome]